MNGQRREARVLVLSNQKGGVGKTTSALNLAYAFSKRDRRVLLIDMDPQATAPQAFWQTGLSKRIAKGAPART